MREYYIDYENVNAAGLEGINELNKGSDTVYIFYSNNPSAVKFDLVKDIINSKIEIKFIKVSAGSKNALDFWLTAHLFFKAKENNGTKHIIISKDTGFDTLIKCGKELGINIERRDLLNNKKTTSKQSVEPHNINICIKEYCAKSQMDLSEKEINQVYNALEKAYKCSLKEKNKAKNSFYLSFVSSLGQKQGLALYNKIKRDYENLFKIYVSKV